jgi:hypothetical protein
MVKVKNMCPLLYLLRVPISMSMMETIHIQNAQNVAFLAFADCIIIRTRKPEGYGAAGQYSLGMFSC